VSERPQHARRTSQATAAERRTSVRHPCAHESFCRPYTQDKGELWWPAQIRDISTGGVGLHMTRRFEPGTVLSLEIVAKGERPSQVLVVRVRHATASENNGWTVGCQFLTPLNDEELEALLR
jgi:hypothetical protein